MRGLKPEILDEIGPNSKVVIEIFKGSEWYIYVGGVMWSLPANVIVYLPKEGFLEVVNLETREERHEEASRRDLEALYGPVVAVLSGWVPEQGLICLMGVTGCRGNHGVS